MKDWGYIVKYFDLPSLDDLDVKDSTLIKEAVETKDIMFLFAIILRLLGKHKGIEDTIVSLSEENKALIEVNDNLIAAINNHEERTTKLEDKIKDLFTVKIKSNIH